MWHSRVETLIVFIQIFGIFAQNLSKFEDESTHIQHLATTSQLPTYKTNKSPYAFGNITHGLRSDPIFLYNDHTIIIPKFYYDGLKPDAFFWIGKGTIPTWSGILAQTVPLNASKGRNVAIVLPNNFTADSIDYLSVWCPSQNESFGHVSIPRNYSQVPESQEVKENTTLITLHKCCEMNEVLTSSGCTPSDQQFNPDVPVHVHNETHIVDDPIPAQSITFRPVVQHIECKGQKYPLQQDQDQYALLQNGTLIVLSLQKLLPPGNYCFETVNFGDQTNSAWLTTPIVCFTDEIPKSSTVFYIYATGILFSAVLLFITAGIFLKIKEIRDTRGKCVIGFSITMGAAFILLAFAQFFGIENTTCTVFGNLFISVTTHPTFKLFTRGFIIQFFLVKCFVWLTVLSWETFYKIKNYNNDYYSEDKRRFKIYLSIGIAVPVLTFLISYVVDRVPGIPNTFLKPKFGRNECWFDQSTKTMVYFYFPIGITICINIILNILMKIYLVYFERNGVNDIAWKTTKIDLKPMFRSCVFVLIVMALCWIMEVITFSVPDLGSFGITMDIIDSLQGVFVFAIFVLHRPVKDELIKLKSKNYFRKLRRNEELKTDVEFKNGGTDYAAHNLFAAEMRVDSTEDCS